MVDAKISGIVLVIFASFNWLTVTLEIMKQLQLTLVTQTIPEMKSLNASAQSSRSSGVANCFHRQEYLLLIVSLRPGARCIYRHRRP